MFNMPKYKDRISLIPGGCPQLLDFEVDLNTVRRLRKSFEERQVAQADGTVKTTLYPLVELEDGDLVDVIEKKPALGETYDMDLKKALDPWLNRWIPLPFLREREQKWEDETEERRVEEGPSNWVRARLARSEAAPDVLRLVVAFDMQVEKRGERYCALSPDDVSSHAQFRLAWRPRDNSWFLNLVWVDDWLREVWEAGQKKDKRRRDEDEEGPQLAHLAGYLTLLEFLHHHVIRGEKGRDMVEAKVYVINPEHHSPIDVDLVLDIGNSRSAGILVETQAQRATNLNDSYLLQLRDMDRPERVYTEPFETRVEFSEISFGNDAHSRKSGRATAAFAWPSPVRIGPEAARLSTLSLCVEGATGMSSPKRYLWDGRDWRQTWRFNTKGKGEPYVTRGLLAQQVNQSGSPLCCLGLDPQKEKPLYTRRDPHRKILQAQEKESAFESLFTRSSLMMFLLVELLQQALLTINSPGQRERRDLPDVPRRLRQVIFTVPPGMPLAEQRIYRRWAKWAVRVLWETLGWGHFHSEKPAPARQGGRADYRMSPQVRCDWDEATCTQLVYIYNEITRKFQGDARACCELAGRARPSGDPRKGKKNVPSLRVATIDIGGGTTDLAVTTFELESDAGSTPRMVAQPEFHDGFNLAGDDVLMAVVREHVLDAIGKAMDAAGVGNSSVTLANLFGRESMDRAQEERNRRAQFIRQVAAPVALCVLAVYEKADLKSGSGVTTLRFRDCFRFPAPEDGREDEAAPKRDFIPHPAPSADVLRYVEDYVACNSRSDEPFSLLDAPLVIEAKRVDETVRSALKEVLTNLCEVIRLYDCDALLLTGRPSRWQGIVDTVFSQLPVPPDRIIPMGDYKVGGWYPFADAMGNMTDPKTTVVVGAILCALAEGHLEGFSFDPSRLALNSTARYIGEMELNGQIKRPKVWFEVDVAKGGEYSKEIIFGGPIAVGFRQLEVERWTTTRFYFLDFVDEEARRAHASGLPFKVTLELEVAPLDEDEYRPGEESDRDEGEFKIAEAVDNRERSVNRALEIRLQTLPRDEGFWLDTGIVYG